MLKSLNMIKVVIIGAGISGLSAGIYAARSGFDVTILEQHNIPGGLSTSWSRKGYYFEGGMHWLTGSSEKMPLHRIWLETGALQENNPIENRDPLYNLIDENGKVLSLYRYLPQMQKALIEYAPEDKHMIKKMCRAVKDFTNFHLPVQDIRYYTPQSNLFKAAGNRAPMMGMSISFTREFTMAVNAPPMITPTAMSTTLPRVMKALNSLANLLSFIISISFI